MERIHEAFDIMRDRSSQMKVLLTIALERMKREGGK
jgi:hypothetical protein